MLAANFEESSDWCGASASSPAFPLASETVSQCASGDTQCVTVLPRSRCDKLRSYASGAGSSGSDGPKLFFAREAAWLSTCSVGRTTLLEAIDELTSLVTRQELVTYTNLGSNAINLVIFLVVLVEILILPRCTSYEYDPME